MEKAVLRGKCKKKLLVFTLLLCVLAHALSAPTTSSEGALIGRNHSSHGNLDKCDIGEYISNNGVCCNKCHPGKKLLEDCPERNRRTSCKQCEKETFMAKSNFLRNCLRCRVCRASDFEEEVSPCTIYMDRECRCVKGYYRNVIDSQTHECLECKICRPGCDDLCAPGSPPIEPEPTKPPENVDIVLPVVVACCIALLGVISLVTYLATKKSVKRKMRLRNDGSASSSESNSRDSTKSLIPDPECPERQNLAVPTQECESDLPDCVPKEIKIQQVIYSVLDLVSVRHVKQLVRSLGVSEREIEGAEVDYRSIQEANYQMLKLWAEGGARGGAEARGVARGVARGGTGRGVLPRALLQDLLENLREMDLGGVAEELEEKFRVQ
ncbi:tumor necrosis factor receptor superfamily member 1A [Osmerus mordax]|uniref:tumor necrosis factor receptor superfamily member 1A n=1 Tax=Osmerus mordax TaxID=8014 RepID=UPI00350FD8D9